MHFFRWISKFYPHNFNFITKSVTNGILMVVLSLRATRGRFVNSGQTGPGC